MQKQGNQSLEILAAAVGVVAGQETEGCKLTLHRPRAACGPPIGQPLFICIVYVHTAKEVPSQCMSSDSQPGLKTPLTGFEVPHQNFCELNNTLFQKFYGAPCRMAKQ